MAYKKIASKGYTLEVVSWENDGDNYRTEYMTVGTREEAMNIAKICKELFDSKNADHKPYGVGNTMDGEGIEDVKRFIKDHPEMRLTVSKVDELAWDLMGSSEYYDYRVCDSVTVTYLAGDIMAEVIQID